MKAANSRGEWSPAGASVRITIIPPWWKTRWAYCGYVIVLLAGLGGYHRIQTAKLKREQETNEQLRAVDRLKDEFLANTSHELRTPLNGIIGIAESLLDGVAGPVDPENSTGLSMISYSGRRLSALVNDLLDFSKLKNRDIDLQKRPVDLKRLAEVVRG